MRMTEVNRAMLRLVTVLLVLLQILVEPSWAAGRSGTQAGETPATGNLIQGTSANVVEVIDGDTVVLDDGKEVRLVGIQAPKLPLNRPNFKEWPLAREAKEELEKLILNQR